MKEIEKMKNSDRRVEKLKRMCPTRWVERHYSVRTFIELLHPLLSALDKIKDWSDKKTATEAQLLQSAIERYDFLLSLFVTDYIFSITLPLSLYLQKENLDLSTAVNSAMMVKKSLEEIRIKGEVNFSPIFKKVIEKCQDLGVSVSRPRVTGRQTMRNNVPSETNEEYFRRSLFIPFLDSTIQSLDQKFESHKDTLKPFQLLINSKPDEGRNQTDDIASIKQLAEFYDLETSSVSGEVLLWRQIVQEKKPRNVFEALQHCNTDLLPVLHTLLTIMATLPVTTSTSERSFSSLRALKTYIRNSTGEERLNGLALMYIHQTISVVENEVLDELSQKTRRLNIVL